MQSGESSPTGGDAAPVDHRALPPEPTPSRGRAELGTLLQDPQLRPTGTVLGPSSLFMGTANRQSSQGSGPWVRRCGQREGGLIGRASGRPSGAQLGIGHGPLCGPACGSQRPSQTTCLGGRWPVGTALGLLLFLKDKRKTDTGRRPIFGYCYCRPLVCRCVRNGRAGGQ